jgi:hypothetical protein
MILHVCFLELFLLITFDFALLDKLLFFSSYAVKENAGRLIIGILLNELILDSKVKYLEFCLEYCINQGEETE